MHSGPYHDSTAFLLTIGPDTSHLVVSHPCYHYTPNQVYYLRLKATHARPVYGFQLTADDTAGIGSDIGNFTILDTTNTSLVNIGVYGIYVGHHNATQNNEWTFEWTAPATNIGPITFYWAGNDADGIDSSLVNGDTIYLAQKTILATPGTSISGSSNELSDMSIFPAVCSNNFELQFNLLSGNHVKGQMLGIDGQVVHQVLDETLSPGNYHRDVDISYLVSGIYLLKVQAGTAYLVKKFIRQ